MESGICQLICHEISIVETADSREICIAPGLMDPLLENQKLEAL